MMCMQVMKVCGVRFHVVPMQGFFQQANSLPKQHLDSLNVLEQNLDYYHWEHLC